VVTLTAATAFCSLAVDLGRVQVAKTELRRAADAAAMYGAQGLAQAGPSAARANAADAADDNDADGTPVVLESADVELGLWNATARQFTALTGANEANATAIRVTARRTAARQNAVPLVYARILGIGTCDVQAVSVAKINPRRPGVVGLDFVNMSGNSSGTGNVMDTYNSKDGSSGAATGRAAIYSNGNITLGGSSRIHGDARPGVGKAVIYGGGSGTVTGSVAPLTKPLDYPMESAGNYATGNDNGKLPLPYYESDRDFTVGGTTIPVPGGVYYLKDLTIGSSGTVNLTGAVTIYVTGDLKIDGTINTQSSAPQNLRIVMVTAGTTATIASNSNTYADIYCPGSALTMGGSGTLRGAVIARSITTGGTSRIIFDELYHVTSPSVSLVQ
jgi:hypothetical protein